jgi:hypothetical protein
VPNLKRFFLRKHCRFFESHELSTFSFLRFFALFFQLIEEEKRGKSIELPESSSKDDDEGVGNTEEEDCEHGSDNSSSSSDAEESSEHEEGSPKVDITG